MVMMVVVNGSCDDYRGDDDIVAGVGHQLEGVVTTLKLSSCPNQHLHQKQFNNINTIFHECMDGIKVTTRHRCSPFLTLKLTTCHP